MPPPPATPAICLAACAVLVLASCGADRAPDRDAHPRECLSGEARPFFRPADSTVVAHDFRQNPGRGGSVELVRFAARPPLEITQRGCDTLEQTFTLAIDTAATAWPQARAAAVARLRELAALDARLYALAEYARGVEVVPDDFPVGAPANLAPGLTLRAVPLPTPGSNTWQISFVQDFTAAGERR